MSRQIKDIKDKNSGQFIYPRTHVKAIAVTATSTLGDLLEGNVQAVGTSDIVEDININYLSTGPQTLTAAEKAQAKQNIGIVDVDLTPYATNTSVDNKIAAIDLTSYATKTQVNDKQDKLIVSEHGTSATTYTLTPNVLHKWGTVSSLNLSLGTPSDNTIANYYMFQFTSGSTATSLTLPSSVKWLNEVSIEANKTYQGSILNNCGVIGGF